VSVDGPKKKAKWRAPVMVIAASAAMMLLGCGLCSAGGLSLEGSDTYPVVVSIGTVAFWAGVLGFVVGVLWWLVAIVSG
jgi:hypothetical protein